MKVESAQFNPASHPSVLRPAAIAALVIEAVILTAVGWHNHWLAHPQKTTGIDASQFIEAQVFEMPEEAHLIEKHSAAIAKAAAEPTLSKVANQGRKAKPNETNLPEKNVAQSGGAENAGVLPTHGPIPVFTPQPVIPAYLQNEDLQSSVVIEFLITAQGVVTPRLLSSSGNDELDALAIGTAKKWQFRPAESNHQAIDSKTRLRIVFEVH